jgi:hypothetical protein
MDINHICNFEIVENHMNDKEILEAVKKARQDERVKLEAVNANIVRISAMGAKAKDGKIDELEAERKQWENTAYANANAYKMVLRENTELRKKILELEDSEVGALLIDNKVVKSENANLHIKISTLEMALDVEAGNGKDLKARWEKLYESLNDIYHHLGKGVVWRLKADELCDACEEYVKKKMQELESGGAKNEEPDDFDHDERKIHGNGGEVLKVGNPADMKGNPDTSANRLGTPKPEKMEKSCN